MQAFDLIQAFALAAGGEPPAGQTREPAAAGESFDAMVQGLLDTTGVVGAAHAVEDTTSPEPAEPTPAEADLGAPLDPVDLSVLLSLTAPVLAAASVPVVLAPAPEGGDVASEWDPAGPARARLGGASTTGTAEMAAPGFSGWRAPADYRQPGSAPDPLAAEARERPTAAATHDVETPTASAAPTPAAAEAPAADAITVGATVTAPASAEPQAEGRAPGGTEIPTVHGAPDRHVKIEPAPARLRGAGPRAAIPSDGAIVAPSAAPVPSGGLEGPTPTATPVTARDTRPAEAGPTAQPAVRDLARELARLAAIPTPASTAEPSDAAGAGTGGAGTGREGEPSGHGNARAPRSSGPHAAGANAADAAWTALAPPQAAGDRSVEPVDRAQVPMPSAPAVSGEIVAAPRPFGAPETMPLWTPAVPAPSDSGPGAPGLDALAAARARHMEALLGAGDPDRENLQTIVRTVRFTSSADGVSEARLRLQPEHLGQVALSVRVEQGSVTAHFHAESPEAQRYIETHQHELRTALRQQGLEVKELVVSTDPDRRQQGRQDDAREQPRQRQRRAAPAAWDAPRFEVTV